MYTHDFWENIQDKKQGFGLYVRIKKDNSADRYYFGHMSEVKVKVGDTIKIGDIIGIEGSTGKSTSPHCHYCARGNSSKQEIRDISAISGIPNALGVYDDGYRPNKKSVSEIVKEVYKKNLFKRYFWLLVGCFIAAFGFNVFSNSFKFEP